MEIKESSFKEQETEEGLFTLLTEVERAQLYKEKEQEVMNWMEYFRFKLILVKAFYIPVSIIACIGAIRLTCM